MVQHTREHSARAAGRGRDYGASGCILLAYSKRIGKDHPACPEHVFVALCPYEILRRLPAEMDRPRQHTLLVKSALDGLAHHFPYL